MIRRVMVRIPGQYLRGLHRFDSTVSETSSTPTSAVALEDLIRAFNHPPQHPPSSPSTPSTPSSVPSGSLSAMALSESLPNTVTPSLRSALRHDPILSHFVNCFMKDGKKTQAERHLLRALHLLPIQAPDTPLSYFVNAIEKVSPLVRINTIKRASKVIPIPFPLSDRQRHFRGIKWILDAVYKRSETRVWERLAGEIRAIHEGNSKVLDKQNQVYKEAIVARSNLQWQMQQANARRRRR